MKYTTAAEVLARLEDDDPSEKVLEMIESGIDDAGDEIEFHVGKAWSEGSLPNQVSRLAARAVARWIRNPDGFTQSRSADETLIWDEPVGEVQFTDEEIARLRSLAGAIVVSGFAQAKVTVPGLAGRRDRVGYVPVSGHGSDFPWFPIENNQAVFFQSAGGLR